MFYNKMTEYSIEKPVIKRDEYGYAYTAYEFNGVAYLFITQLDTTQYNANDLQLLSKQYIAHTYNTELDTNWRISDGFHKYIVDYAGTPQMGERILYLTLVDQTAPNPDSSFDGSSDVLPITFGKLDEDLQSRLVQFETVSTDFIDGVDFDELTPDVQNKIEEGIGPSWGEM